MVTSHHRTSVLRRSFPAPPIISTTVALAQQDSAQGVTLILTGELFSGVRNSKSAETSTSTGQKPVVLWTPLTKPTELVRPPPPSIVSRCHASESQRTSTDPKRNRPHQSLPRVSRGPAWRPAREAGGARWMTRDPQRHLFSRRYQKGSSVVVSSRRCPGEKTTASSSTTRPISTPAKFISGGEYEQTLKRRSLETG